MHENFTKGSETVTDWMLSGKEKIIDDDKELTTLKAKVTASAADRNDARPLVQVILNCKCAPFADVVVIFPRTPRLDDPQQFHAGAIFLLHAKEYNAEQFTRVDVQLALAKMGCSHWRKVCNKYDVASVEDIRKAADQVRWWEELVRGLKIEHVPVVRGVIAATSPGCRVPWDEEKDKDLLGEVILRKVVLAGADTSDTDMGKHNLWPLLVSTERDMFCNPLIQGYHSRRKTLQNNEAYQAAMKKVRERKQLVPSPPAALTKAETAKPEGG